ncbi:hypothetical protein [Streptomyces nanshensis]|uniref:Uncharacterized protein n=1 Tax=Streptomyces nanshensis TaxID=518642 RepID=A0A1E7LB13_9ACTN|nr:hypothetical protein [Streptomyces nanshensis]OEV13399.1 hypothetical protein AN218_03675 [Streptomyces nanshensis]
MIDVITAAKMTPKILSAVLDHVGHGPHELTAAPSWGAPTVTGTVEAGADPQEGAAFPVQTVLCTALSLGHPAVLFVRSHQGDDEVVRAWETSGDWVVPVAADRCREATEGPGTADLGLAPDFAVYPEPGELPRPE